MIEWFERAGLKPTADVIRRAVAVFGDEFPRSQAARNEFLSTFKGKRRADWDPFFKMDDEFYASLPYKEKVFEQAADKWLREVCGVKQLTDPVPRNLTEN